MLKGKKLLIITNVDWFLISHRLVIAKAAVKQGWKVYVACEDTGRGNEIMVEGIEFIPFAFSRSGTSIIKELQTYQRFVNLYKKLKPDVVHQITIKPVVYGSIAAKRLGITGVVNAISGLGYMFVGEKIGLVQKLILKLMKYGFSHANTHVIFQNQNDQNTLVRFNILNSTNRVHLIKGSGVNLNYFNFTPLPKDEIIRILFPCRMLWDKGVRELREASDLLKAKYFGKIQFILVGMSDRENKSGVSEEYLRDWECDDYVIWKGHQPNILDYYKNCHIVVLPSYREGLPKTLIEACAVGRPIVTTDAVGCRDCVDEGKNGYKVPVGNGKALTWALEQLINNMPLMKKMGAAGRKKAELEFNVDDVVNRHLNIYLSMLDKWKLS